MQNKRNSVLRMGLLAPCVPPGPSLFILQIIASASAGKPTFTDCLLHVVLGLTMPVCRGEILALGLRNLVLHLQA